MKGKCKPIVYGLLKGSRISGEVHYKSLQMDRGAALNCRVVHNWNESEEVEEIEEQVDEHRRTIC